VSARVATAATAVVGLAAFGLAGSASVAASVGAVHDLTGEYNVPSNGSLASHSPLARATWWERPAPSATPPHPAPPT
jgi:hypothetical protein